MTKDKQQIDDKVTLLPHQKIEPIVPKMNRKYRLLCKKVRRKYKKVYISYDSNNKPSINVVELMCILIDELRPAVNSSYCRHVKYEPKNIVRCIIEIINNCMYWVRYKGIVPGKYLNQCHNNYVKWGVYDCLYLILLEEYLSKDKFGKLKNQSIDTTFCTNLYGSEMIGRNIKYKSKNGIKISVKVDKNGVPFSLGIASGNQNDCIIAKKCHINKSFIDPESKRVHNSKYQQKIVADAAYYDKEFHDNIRKTGCIPIIDVNKRNTKDEEKLKVMEKDKKKYIKEGKNRYIVESFNSWIHKFPKITKVVEKSIRSFKGLILLACSLIISNKIT